MTKDQIKYVRGLLAKAGLTDVKPEIVASHTDGRTESLTAMTYAETQDLIAYLKAYIQEPPSPAEKMRNKILSAAHEMKWHKAGTRKVDIDRVNKFLLAKKGYALDDLPYLDLCDAVTMTEAVLVSYLKGI